MEDDSFKLIAITPESNVENEIEFVTTILDMGFDYVHVRKPAYSEAELIGYIASIPAKYHCRLKIHDHFGIATKYGIGGIHLNRRNRYAPIGYSGKLSKSCHSMDELDGIKQFEYVFLSPIFNSISKSGYCSNFSMEELEKSTAITSKVIALGGVTADNITQLNRHGFGGAALLGYLFQSKSTCELKDKIYNIINTIKQCCNS